jgi:hypothetical protein
MSDQSDSKDSKKQLTARSRSGKVKVFAADGTHWTSDVFRSWERGDINKPIEFIVSGLCPGEDRTEISSQVSSRQPDLRPR